MPYASVDALPEQVRKNLPKGAQEIFKEAFNSAWEQYKDPKKRKDDASLEETANKVAWAAVKKSYKKSGEEWVKK